ncbi:MAG TPA: tetratricopeptide repeat protein, partial [Vicinamibacterales bacterium]|nr:tetratricopeptide repeat protein [Vicinamibacterales bacterium]
MLRLVICSMAFFAAAAGSAQTAQTPADHLRAGQQYQRQGRLQDAEAEYRKAVDLDPKEADIASLYGQVLLGQLCSARGDYPCAIAQLQRALRRDPTLGKAHYFLGITFTLAGQQDR